MQVAKKALQQRPQQGSGGGKGNVKSPKTTGSLMKKVGVASATQIPPPPRE